MAYCYMWYGRVDFLPYMEHDLLLYMWYNRMDFLPCVEYGLLLYVVW